MLQKDDREFADLLIEWGLMSRDELDEALQMHLEALKDGNSALPFAETLIKFGYLTPRQVAEAKAADAKGIFRCGPCDQRFAVRISSSRQTYRCPKCQRPLVREQGHAAPTAAIPPLQDSVPVDVQVALHRPDSRFGKYVLISEAGRGGDAVIWKSWDMEERCYVAVKLLRTIEGAAIDPSRVEALVREGERAVFLRHPNIIPVYEVGHVGSQYYLSMEYLEGHPLIKIIQASRARGGISPFFDEPVKYLAMLRDVARAVHYAHSRLPPIIHCDLKPHNIFIELSWRPYVLDFGVAQELRPGAPGAEAGTLKGSPAYMAPEQIRMRPDEIDVRTDVYGLGAILYELLAGRPPIAGELDEVLVKGELLTPPRPSEVLEARSTVSGTARKYVIPPQVEEICMRCLSPEKGDRFQSAREVADALGGVVKAQPEAKKKDDSLVFVVERNTARRVRASQDRAKLVLIGIGCVALALGLAWGVVRLSTGRAVVRASPTLGVRMAQDQNAAELEIEAAVAGYRDFAGSADAGQEPWINDRLAEIHALKELRGDLAEFLTRTKPVLPELRLKKQVLQQVRIDQATEVGLQVDVQRKRNDVRWGDLEPRQLLDLARRHRELTPQAQLGLWLYAVLNGLAAEASALRSGLRDLPHEAVKKSEAERQPKK